MYYRYELRSFRLVIGFICVLAVVPVWSQPPQGRGPQPFNAYDEDGDGYVSRAEFEAMREERRAAREQAGMPMRGAATAPGFSDFDSNGDGKLSQEELVAGQQAMRAARGGAGGGAGPGGRGAMGGQMPSFGDFDLDGNGRISEDEFVEARNERLTERANEGRPLRNLANVPAFAELDENGDGAINAEEFARHQAQRRTNRGR
jgi:Ca2+-binding EF-hand superfamily protein